MGGDLMGGKTSNAAKMRYNRKAYDQVNISIPKGNRPYIASAAAAIGQSINQYIASAILSRLGLSSWPINPRQDAADPPGDNNA